MDDRQPALFSNTASGDSATAAELVARVVFNCPPFQPFDYLVPADMVESIAVGKRVLVPLGRRSKPITGYCVELFPRSPRPADVEAATPDAAERSFQLKPIARVVDEEPLLTPVLLRLTRWMADYYLCSWGQVLDAIVPAGAKEQSGTRVRVFVEPTPPDERPDPLPRLTPRQTRVWSLLQQQSRRIEVSELARSARCGPAVVLALVRKGLARRSLQRTEQFQPPPSELSFPELVQLNADQNQALWEIEGGLRSGGFRPFLLHGVTGSGKTEVYLKAIEATVQQGKEAIVLVPEISLTPQTISRFRGRFPHVAVLHSHLGDAERGWYWRQIAAGRMQVVVGARSAIFAPTKNLGLIVVDEEHETSFKQETTPRYHARDVAVMRAQMEGVPVVLGSATPSLESWHNARRGQYRLLSLPKRVLDLPLPHVHLIDLRHEPVRHGRFRGISPTLEQAIGQALDQGGQVILLLNRRGFSTFVCCPSCGYVVKCRFCDVTLTYHSQRSIAMCHYCGHEQQLPGQCPECRQSRICYFGYGTEKLEAEVSVKFPGVAAERMDSDTMRRPGRYAEVLDAFRRGEVRILLGTQMIAKGLDFPNVTLVGVINADLALFIPDFRSAERTFQLVAQVAGRTGRGPQGGRVLVQTFNPEQPCIQLAAAHNYEAFAESELTNRRDHAYPPFARLARVILRSRDRSAAAEAAGRLAGCFGAAARDVPNPGSPVRILGPAEAPLFRLKNYYRYHFQVQSESSAALHQAIRSALARFLRPRNVDVVVDIDPVSVL